MAEAKEAPVGIQVKRLEKERLQIEQNVLGCELRLYELEEERERLQTNIEASGPALDEIAKKIQALQK